MTAFNPTELRAMALATGLLLLGAAARLGLGPGPADFAWVAVSDSARPGSGLAETKRRVADGLAAEALARQPLAPGERVDPNTASLEELRRLPGIGPSRATAIVAERTAGGPFTDLEDLARVPGIGPAGLTKLAPHMALGRRRNVSVAALSADSAASVDVNRAQIKELEQITGIGPVLAARIVETRRRVGQFQRPEDLLLVPGIGPATLTRIRGQVRF